MIHVVATSGEEIIRNGMVDIAVETARRLNGTAAVEMECTAPVKRAQMALDYAREELSLNGDVLILYDAERDHDAGLCELESAIAYSLRNAVPAISDDEVKSMVKSVLIAGCRTMAGEQVLLHVMDRLALFASCIAVVDKTGEALHSARAGAAVELRPSIECGATNESEIWVRVRVPLVFYIFSTSGACGALAEDAPIAVCHARFEQHFIFEPLSAAAARGDSDGDGNDGNTTKSLCEVHCEVSDVRPTRVRVRHALRSAAATAAAAGGGEERAGEMGEVGRAMGADAMLLSDAELCFILDELTTRHDEHDVAIVDLSGCTALTETSVLYVADIAAESLVELNLAMCAGVSNRAIARLAECCTRIERINVGWCPLVRDAAITRLAECAAAGLRVLKLSECTGVSDAALVALAAHCPGLRDLVVDWCPLVSGEALRAVAESCRELTCLSTRFCERVTSASIVAVARGCAFLESLRVAGCRAVDENALAELAEHCHWLRVLDVSGCGRVTDDAVATVVSSCTLLESLALSGCVRITDRALRAVATHCRALRELDVDSCTALSDASLLAVIGGCARLRDVHISHLPNVTLRVIKALARSCPQLRTIRLSAATVNVKDATLVALARGCTQLTRLSLAGCTSISDRAVIALADACPHLSDLDLSGCVRLTAASAARLCACVELRDVDFDGCDEIGTASRAQLAARIVHVHG